MAFSSTWDLEKYKSEFESDEHWQLRKNFMQAHKDKFTEDKLVCLARVFCNVEFLGCRYPEKTMKLVAELSKGVADDYREKQKGKLKRTFVQASDAAGAKIKGTGAITPSKITEGPPSKILKTSESNTSSGLKYSCFVHENLVKPVSLAEGEFPGFIIYEHCKTNCPINILTQSSQKNIIWNTINFGFPEEKNRTSNQERYCEITLNQKVLSSGIGMTNKEAKVNAAIAGLNKLRQTCYTIQEKLSFFTDGELVSKDNVVKGKEALTPLPEDNIGSRMMMKMGWTGTGLGKNQQGIKAPIEASQTMHRSGFGHLSTPQFHAKFRKVFQDYIASGSSNDLVFAPDFSADERKILHRLAQNMNLKTKSHGKNEQRHLVVYKIMTLPEILTVLLQCRGENEKYLLLHPEGVDSSNSVVSSSHEVVDKENPNFSVRKVPSDDTKYKEVLLTSNSKPENTSQCLRVPVVSYSNLCASDCTVQNINNVNKETKGVHMPEIVVLSSDDDLNSLDKLEDYAKNKLDAAGSSNCGTRIGIKYKDSVVDEEDNINVINRVIQMKKEEITMLQTGMEKLLTVYREKKCFTKREKKKYIHFRRVLQNISGTFILSVLNPQWTIEKWRNGKIPLKDVPNNFKMRCEFAGLAEIEKNTPLKQEIFHNLKKKLRVDKLIDNRQIRKAIRFQCQRIGSKIVSDFVFVEKGELKKTRGSSNQKESRRKYNIKRNKSISFVKQSEFKDGSDSSGMEYSDDNMGFESDD